MPSNLHVAHYRSFRVLKSSLHNNSDVGPCSPPSVVGVGAIAMPLCIALSSHANFRRYLSSVYSLAGGYPLEAIRNPTITAVEPDRDGGKFRTRAHQLGILRDQGRIGDYAVLGSPIPANRADFQQPDFPISLLLVGRV